MLLLFRASTIVSRTVLGGLGLEEARQRQQKSNTSLHNLPGKYQGYYSYFSHRHLEILFWEAILNFLLSFPKRER